MFGIGMPELILILAIALMVIGPKKLPDLAKSLGRAMREFKKATNELKGSLELDSEMTDVKDTFHDIKSNIEDSVLQDGSGDGSAANSDRKVADLEKGYGDWQKERASDLQVDAQATSDSPPETNDARRSPDPAAGRPDDTSEKES